MKKIKLAICSIVMAIANLANAGLIEADYESINDNLAVYDTETKLTWLDLSLTAGMSYNSVSAAFTGWRYATYQEVGDLIDRNITTISNEDGYAQYIAYKNKNIFDKAVTFGKLFGKTGKGRFHYGLFSDENLDLRMAGMYKMGKETLIVYGPRNKTLNNRFREDGHAYFGSYMIKQEVPEPSTFAIFVLGMIALASRRFKKQS